jgi:hypothetical protein
MGESFKVSEEQNGPFSAFLRSALKIYRSGHTWGFTSLQISHLFLFPFSGFLFPFSFVLWDILKLHFSGLVLLVSSCEQPREEKVAVLFTTRRGVLPDSNVALRGRRLRAMLVWQATPASQPMELSEVRYQSPGSDINFIRIFWEQIWKYQSWYSHEH